MSRRRKELGLDDDDSDDEIAPLNAAVDDDGAGERGGSYRLPGRGTDCPDGRGYTEADVADIDEG